VAVKVKPKPQPETVPDSQPVKQEEYVDVMAQLRAEAGETAPKPVVTAKATPVVAPRGTAGVPIDSEVARWIRHTKLHIKRKWVLTPGFRTQDFETHVSVNIDQGGVVRGEPKITSSSGNPWYDKEVVNAIIKSSPLPSPPEAGRWAFVFSPEDIL
jgi:outer membrane biosynthesis protein TonB